jgi:phosphatidylserine/phosphatidylglycerophosphate/cardiolipin synthase-like enzyme
MHPLLSPWHDTFTELVGSAKHRLVLCAPFVTDIGTNAVRESRRKSRSSQPDALILTDLSPAALCTGATDPMAVRDLKTLFQRGRVVHLPRLHAKVYVADGERAIVTSGNLTRGGLIDNYECGMLVDDHAIARAVERAIADFASVGTIVDDHTLETVCDLAAQSRAEYNKQVASTQRDIGRRLERTLALVKESLLHARLAGEAVHTIFARSIEYALRRYGPLTTRQLHPIIQSLHPDLCDDSIDRVIDGKRFGKKWKHAVRTAQQMLKHRGVVTLRDEMWCLES